MSKIVDETYHAEEAGYTVPTTPKTRSFYDDAKRSFIERDNYSLKKLQKAEKVYLKLQKEMKENFSDAFIIKQLNSSSRIAELIPNNLFNQGSKNFLKYQNLGLFTVSLQNGRIYNFPVAQLSKHFNFELDTDNTYLRSGGNKGCPVKEALKYLNKTRNRFSELFNEYNHVMTDKEFATMFVLMRIARNGDINFDVNGWIEYLIAGKDIDTIMFGFNRRMFNGSMRYLPVDEVDEYKDLPAEWLATVFRTLSGADKFQLF